jgi:glyoxylase I family protein
VEFVSSVLRYETGFKPTLLSNNKTSWGKYPRCDPFWIWKFAAMEERNNMKETSTATIEETRRSPTALGFVKDFHGVRYQIGDVGRAIAFYTGHLGFKIEHQQLPAFANVSLGKLDLLLSGPEASGSRPMPSGERQKPGGWNRIVLRVSDLPACIDRLRDAGLHFRNEMEVGPGGKQIQLEDPDGNAIELFEPVSRQ